MTSHRSMPHLRAVEIPLTTVERGRRSLPSVAIVQDGEFGGRARKTRRDEAKVSIPRMIETDNLIDATHN